MRFIKDNGRAIIQSFVTFACLLVMILAGLAAYNQELVKQGHAAVLANQYARSEHFLSALFENWESEFLQMSAYVVLTAFLYQRGSAGAKDRDEETAQEVGPVLEMHRFGAPAIVRSGKFLRTRYSYSLSLALFGLFVLSFFLHLWQSGAGQAVDTATNGRLPPSVNTHLLSAQFWFKSFQNWQSEFFSTAVLVLFSIFLRFRGSPESKPVAAPHAERGA